MANKTYYKNQWYFIDAKGRRGDPAPEFDEGADALFVEEGLGYGPVKPERVQAVLDRIRPRPVVLKPGQKEYRVITQSDQWFMGKFSPERLNSLLNLLASEGWKLTAVAAADRGTWFGSFAGGARQEMVMFMERDVVAETTVNQYAETLKDQI